MNELSIQELGLVLMRPVMTDRGVGILKRLKGSGHQCTVSFDGPYEKLFYAHEIQPILKPMLQLTFEDDIEFMDKFYAVKYIHQREVKKALWCLGKGYDSMYWIDAGLAVNESEITEHLLQEITRRRKGARLIANYSRGAYCHK